MMFLNAFYLHALKSYAITLAFSQSMWTRNSDLDNYVYTNSFLWEESVPSTVECAASCSEDAKCVMFTVTSGYASEGIRCRGHSDVIVALGDVSCPGAKVFQRELEDPGPGTTTLAGTTTTTTAPTTAAPTGAYYLGSQWLTKTCSFNSQCSSVANAECFVSKCLCTPGYFYWASVDQCRSYCNASLLQATFVLYPSAYIFTNNVDESYLAMTAAECRSWCLNYQATNGTTCLTVDYDQFLDICWVAKVTALQAPADWSISVTGDLIHYQRTCY